MSRSKKMLWIMWLILAFIALGVLSMKISFSINEKKAVQIAQEYLSQKYTQEMKYLSIRFSWIEPSLYHVTFSPANLPEMTFEVKVQSDLTLKEQANQYGNFIPDDYYLRFFSFKTSELLKKDVKKIWGGNANIVVSVETSLYAHKVPVELNEQMTAKEMANYLSFDFHVLTDRLLDNDAKKEEINNILAMIQSFKANAYEPIEILFWYKTGNYGKEKVLVNYNTWPEMNICIKNWSNITTSEQVEKIIDEEWFNRLHKSH